MPHTPRALIFDLGGVIVPLDFPRVYSRLESLCGIPAAEIPRRIAATGLVAQLESGRIEPEPFAEQILRSLGIPGAYPEFCGLWSGIFPPGTLLPEEMFVRLRENYRLVLLSNTNAIHYEWLAARHPLLEHFHDHVLSYKVGCMKPDPEIFRLAVERAGVPAAECFFTDDSPVYVDAARAFGIDAVRFESREQLERELLARGVLCTTSVY